MYCYMRHQPWRFTQTWGKTYDIWTRGITYDRLFRLFNSSAIACILGPHMDLTCNLKDTNSCSWFKDWSPTSSSVQRLFIYLRCVYIPCKVQHGPMFLCDLQEGAFALAFKSSRFPAECVVTRFVWNPCSLWNHCLWSLKQCPATVLGTK